MNTCKRVFVNVDSYTCPYCGEVRELEGEIVRALNVGDLLIFRCDSGVHHRVFTINYRVIKNLYTLMMPSTPMERLVANV